MFADIVNALGGVGLFLFGMIWLTEGLRELAGQALRRALARFTRTPLSGAVTGAATTALIQSSSATTVTAVGFVSAGLLTFPQALGIIFGANIGTTATGWITAILGFKLDLGQITLPLVFLGALARLFGGPKLKSAGIAVAGFALLFLGIEVMKTSLDSFEGLVTPADFPQDSILGRLALIGIGMAITIVTQSSSAGVATALAVLGAGAINLPQAMAMVIGMDVGTTVTAVLATLGGSTAARRTGLSHVIYNILTAIMAFFLLSPYSALIALPSVSVDPQIALVAFHTGFNIIGVILILPFATPFARFVTWIVRDKGSALTMALGKELLRDPKLAFDAVTSALGTVVRAHFNFLAHRSLNSKVTREDTAELHHLREAITELRSYVEAIAPTEDPGCAAQRATALHILDHLSRLQFRCTQDARIAALSRDRRLTRLVRVLSNCVAKSDLDQDLSASESRFKRLRRLMRDQRESFRLHTMERTPMHGLTAEEMGLRLDAMRWLHRVSYHLWRISFHMLKLQEGRSPASPNREAAVDVLTD
ncbi:Na/Pi cotransporter family protein [Celeribacter sp. PS-C1]|uniref:Na/Pi cotransporter family protein n=1 Tax=Celeribacter sp. PS-C1 TaxID=2820813 RepID=UPI001CA49E11|nr:Na/Pi symporter [Celeribacter sp. PS-C1]MBW6417286.1 Na/Pi symporter [Celeribacter sp. PS-C1]